MATVIVGCTCKHLFQDKEYGQSKRVANICGVKGSLKARCTVCGVEKPIKG